MGRVRRRFRYVEDLSANHDLFCSGDTEFRKPESADRAQTRRRIEGNGMNLARQIHGWFIELRGREPDVSWKILNLTRQAVLADRVEVADRGAKRSKGLLGRNGLGSGEGLWIVPCEAVHTFFMRFPIDLIYVDSQKRVKKVRSGVPPWRMSACFSAHSVIELPSGTIRTTQTKAGDNLKFSPADLLDENLGNISSL